MARRPVLSAVWMEREGRCPFRGGMGDIVAGEKGRIAAGSAVSVREEYADRGVHHQGH